MHDINLIDPGLKNYHNETMLSIQLRLDGFSFAIHSAEDRKLRAFRHYPLSNMVLQEDLLNATRDILQKDDLLRLPQQAVKVIYTHNRSTLLPNDFISDEHLKQVLEFNQPIDDLDEIHKNSIPEHKAQLIYTLPTYFGSMIYEKFNSTCFFNQATPLLAKCTNIQIEGSIPLIVLQLNRDFFDLVVVADGKLRMYNTFLYKDINDLLYFTLYVCKQLDIDSKKAAFKLTGYSTRETRLLDGLKPYIPSVEALNANVDYAVSKFNKLDTNRFYSLLSLIDCE